MKQKSLFLLLTLGALGLLSGLLFSRGTTSPVLAQDFGTGPWAATFYNNPTFTAPSVASTTYTVLNLNWGTGAPTDAAGTPLAGVNADNFSAMFTSSQVFNPGTYTFSLTVDDRAKLFLNNTLVIDNTTPGTTATASAVLAGGTVNMRVEYIEVSSVAFLQLSWLVAGGGGGTPATGLPPGVTLTPTLTPAPTATGLPPIPPGALTATVIRASVLNVRQAPSTGAARLGRLLRGQTYAVIGRDPEARWFLLQLSGFQGWAFGYYLFIDGNEFSAPVVSGNALIGLAGQPDYGVRAQTEAGMRLRAAPTTASEQIGRIDWGAFLPVVGRSPSGLWWKVVWKNTVGWVYSPFLRVVEGDIRNVPITSG